MLKRNTNKVKFEKKFILATFQKKNIFFRWGQAHFYLPHLILTFAQKSQGGQGPPLRCLERGGKRTTASPPAHATEVAENFKKPKLYIEHRL